MIDKLSIRNFKSIKKLDLDCRKFNLFIGEPNTGKSNILEALGFLSCCGSKSGKIKDFIRLEETVNLFYDNITDDNVNISFEKNGMQHNLLISYDNEVSKTEVSKKTYEDSDELNVASSSDYYKPPYPKGIEYLSFIKFYRFKNDAPVSQSGPKYLVPPYGTNLVSSVHSSSNMREIVTKYFAEIDFDLVFKRKDKTFVIQKRKGDFVEEIPYSMASDTLRRMVFFRVAMESNSDSTLVFEEPSAFAFPYYVKHLGERIAFDETNQFFVGTHNPYMIKSIIEKSNKKDVKVFITYMKNFETLVKPLSSEDLSELLELDPFFNIDKYLTRD